MSELVGAELVARLAARQQTVGIAESLTGGAVTQALTAPAGASAVVLGGVVPYATQSKSAIVGVDPALLARVGPVHPDVARELARGARRLFAATWGIGITGVAGPDEQNGHPVGEVHVAIAGDGDEQVATLALDPSMGREGIRQGAVEACLNLLGRALGEEAG